MIDKKIKDKVDCVGCYACTNICPLNCISMNIDSEGSWYPKVDYDRCLYCEKCIDVCPTLNYKVIKNDPIAYACINKNETVRIESSSGGLFSLIAEKIIDDGGVVFGAGFNENFEVVHSYVDNKEELEKFRGSKYVQSNIGKSFSKVKEILESGRKVLFSGTPCQIAGIKSFLGKSYEKLLCIDVICYGVPLPDVWEKYLRYREKAEGSLIKKISFRNKNEGWRQFSMSILFEDGTEYIKNFEEDYYLKAYTQNLTLRLSCYACNFKTLHRQSDITIADFWGIENIFPELDDDRGTSLIFINSTYGRFIFEQIKDKILFKKVDIYEAVKYNPTAIKSAPYNPKREKFLKELNCDNFDQVVKKYC